jgi:hypothetical protein
MNTKAVALLVFLAVLIINKSLAITYTSAAAGAWTTTTNWSPNGTPGNGDVIVINHAITRGASSLTWWSAGSITINSGGSLSFSGNTDFTGSGVNIYVNTGGSMSVTGTLDMNNQSELALQGGTLSVSGAFTVHGGTFSSTSGSSATVASVTTTSSGSTSFTNSGTLTTSGSGSVTAGGAITNSGTMNIGGDLIGVAAVITNNGTMNISGSVDLPSSSKLYTNPGATVIVNQNVTTRANQNLVIGTNANPPPYADFVVKGNLNSAGSGDILVDKNGRLAVFGNFSSTGGGGSIFTVNDGGMVYVNGTITFNGGGDHLTNNNDGVPYGFYSNNQPVYNGGGGSSNGTAASNSVQNEATMQTDAPAFFTWVAAQPGSPLPVTLIYFGVGEMKTNIVKLVWATASELNFDYFSLQRSKDGFNFEEIARVNGHGTSSQRHEYSFEDKSALLGKSYYQLTSVDFDGYSETFDIISVDVTGERAANIYPNPVLDGQLFIDINFQSPVWLIITNLNGIEMGRVQISDLRTKVDLPVTPGIYLLKVVADDLCKVTRLVVY